VCMCVCVCCFHTCTLRGDFNCRTTLSPPPHPSSALSLFPSCARYRSSPLPHSSTNSQTRLFNEGNGIASPARPEHHLPLKRNERIPPLSSPCLCAITETEAKPKLRPAGIKMLKCLWVGIPTSALFLFGVSEKPTYFLPRNCYELCSLRCVFPGENDGHHLEFPTSSARFMHPRCNTVNLPSL